MGRKNCCDAEMTSHEVFLYSYFAVWHCSLSIRMRHESSLIDFGSIKMPHSLLHLSNGKHSASWISTSLAECLIYSNVCHIRIMNFLLWCYFLDYSLFYRRGYLQYANDANEVYEDDIFYNDATCRRCLCEEDVRWVESEWLTHQLEGEKSVGRKEISRWRWMIRY